MKLKLFSGILGTGLLTISANAGVMAGNDIIISEYTTAGSTQELSPNQSADSITATNLVAGSGLTFQEYSTFNFQGWDISSTSYDLAIAANDFWSWGFEVDTNVNVNLSKMNFRIDRSGTGPHNVEIRAYVNDNSGISLFTYDFKDSKNGVTFAGDTAVDLSSIGTLSMGDSIVFKLAAYNSDSPDGSFDLETVTYPGGTDSMQLIGTIAAVPEPASLALFGLGGLAILRRRR